MEADVTQDTSATPPTGGAAPVVDIEAAKKAAVKEANRLLYTQNLFPCDITNAYKALKEHHSADEISAFGAAHLSRLLDRNDPTKALDLIDEFKIRNGHLNKPDLHRGFEFAIGNYSAASGTTTYSTYYGRTHGNSSQGYWRQEGSNQVWVSYTGTTGASSSRPGATQLTTLVDLAEEAGLPPARVERALLNGIASGLKEYNKENVVREMVYLLPNPGNLTPENKKEFLTRLLPAMLSTSTGTSRASEVKHLLTSLKNDIGISKDEIADSVCVALERLLEIGEYQRYKSTRDNFGLSSIDLNRNKLGTVITARVHFHLAAGDGTKATEAVKLLANSNGFEAQAKKCALNVLRTGEYYIANIINDFKIPSDFLVSPEVKRAAKTGAFQLLSNGKSHTTSTSWQGGYQVTKTEPSFPFKDLVRLSGLDGEEMRDCAKSAARQALRKGDYGRFYDIGAACEVIDDLLQEKLVQRNARDLVIKALDTGHVNTLSELLRLPLCSTEVIHSAKVQEAAERALISDLQNGKIKHAKHYCEIFKLDIQKFREDVQAAAIKLLTNHTITDTAGVTKNVTEAIEAFGIDPKHADARELKRAAGQFVFWNGYRQKSTEPHSLTATFGLDSTDAVQAVADNCSRMIRRGEFLVAEGFAKHYEVEPQQLYANVDKKTLEQGLTFALSFGWSPYLERIIADIGIEFISSPSFREAARKGIKSEIRLGNAQGVEALVGKFSFEPEEIETLAAEEYEDILCNGNMAIAEQTLASVNRALSVGRAILRSVAKNDYERAEFLGATIANNEALLTDTEFQKVVTESLRSLASLGWKPKAFTLVKRLFLPNQSVPVSDELSDAVCQGIELELRERRYDAAVQLREWFNLSTPKYEALILKLAPEILQRSNMTIDQFARNFGVNKGVLKDPSLQKIIEEALLYAYVSDDDIYQSYYIEHDLELAPARVATIRKIAVQSLVKRGLYSRAESLLGSNKLDPETKIGAVIPDLSPYLKGFAERHVCSTIGELIEAGITYAELRYTPRYYGTSTPSYVAFKPTDRNGYNTQEEDLYSKIKNSETYIENHSEIFLLRQKENYTCGPASARMGIEALSGQHYEEYTVRTWLGTNQDIGTPLVLFDRLRAKFPDFDFRVDSGGTREKLKECLLSGALVIINFRPPGSADPHYAVVRGMSDEGLIMADPFYGQAAIKWKDIDWSSGYTEGRTRGGFVAIRYNCGDVLSGGRFAKVPASDNTLTYVSSGTNATQGAF